MRRELVHLPSFKSPSETISNDSLLSLLRAASRSPTGINRQPWKFHWNEPLLIIEFVPSRCVHLIYTRNDSPRVSLGCLLESISVAARSEGFEAHFSHVNHLLDSQVVAHVTFKKSTCVASKNKCFRDVSYEMLFERHTDRRAFTQRNLSSELKEEIQNIANTQYPRVGFHLVENHNQELESFILDSETFMWTNKDAHSGLTKWLNVEPGGSSAKDGLRSMDMQIPLPVRAILWSTKNFSVQKLLNPIFLWGFRKKTASLLASSSAYCCLSIQKDSLGDMIALGQFWLHIWCLLNHENYSIHAHCHPTSLVSSYENKAYPFSPEWCDRLEQGKDILSKAFRYDNNREAVVIFRIGTNPKLSKENFSPRLPLKEICTGVSIPDND